MAGREPIFKLFHDIRNCQTREEILNTGKFNYKVAKKPNLVSFEDEFGGSVTVESPYSVATYRTDKTGVEAVLGSVGPNFGLIQNWEMVEFCEHFTAEQEAEFHCVQAPNKGERIFMIMKMPAHVSLGANDEIHAYFCITSAHDGSGCFNAIPLYLHNASQTVITPPVQGSAFKIKHSKNVINRMAKAKVTLRAMGDYWSDYAGLFQDFAQIKLTSDRAHEYFHLVFPGTQAESTRSENVRAKMWDLYSGRGICSGLPSCKETLLGAMMATVEYAEYYQTVKSSKHRDEMAARIQSRLTGSAAELKAKALRMSIKLSGLTQGKQFLVK